MGTFNMKVRRSVDALPDAAPAPAPAAAPAPAYAPAAIITSDMGGLATPEESVDEALVYVTSPKVRRVVGGTKERSQHHKRQRKQAAASASAAAAGSSRSQQPLAAAGGSSRSRARRRVANTLLPPCLPPPQVGIFRRGKYAAGKRIGKDNLLKDVSRRGGVCFSCAGRAHQPPARGRHAAVALRVLFQAPPLLETARNRAKPKHANNQRQGETVKKGQTVGYVEQLGTFVAIEAPQAGEVAKFRVEEGVPVEYGQVRGYALEPY